MAREPMVMEISRGELADPGNFFRVSAIGKQAERPPDPDAPKITSERDLAT